MTQQRNGNKSWPEVQNQSTEKTQKYWWKQLKISHYALICQIIPEMRDSYTLTPAI